MSKKHLLLIFSTAIISGFAIFANSFGVKLTNPTQYTFAKNLFVVLVISSILFIPQKRKCFQGISLKYWLYLALVGLIGGSFAFILFFEGLARTSGSVSAFIHKTIFIWLALAAPLFLKEKVKLLFFVPAMALLFGNFLLLEVDFRDLNWAHLFILGAALLWAAENILSKYLLNQKIAPLVLIWSRMTFGAGFIFIYLLITSNLPLLNDFSPDVLLWIIISGIILTSYVLAWYYGLVGVPVTLAATILLLGSPITNLLSVLFMGKGLVGGQILGILLIALGAGYVVYLFADIAKNFRKGMLNTRKLPIR